MTYEHLFLTHRSVDLQIGAGTFSSGDRASERLVRLVRLPSISLRAGEMHQRPRLYGKGGRSAEGGGRRADVWPAVLPPYIPPSIPPSDRYSVAFISSLHYVLTPRGGEAVTQTRLMRPDRSQPL